MDINKLIEQTRAIVKTHYEGMKRLKMSDSDPAMLKEDLCEKLEAFVPRMNRELMHPLYDALKEKGYATLITNDTITFSKAFIGENDN